MRKKTPTPQACASLAEQALLHMCLLKPEQALCSFPELEPDLCPFMWKSLAVSSLGFTSCSLFVAEVYQSV